MTKCSTGSERMGQSAVIVEVVGSITNPFCYLHLPQRAPGFFHRAAAGECRSEGVRDTLAGRQTQRLLDVNY